jgi:predicted peptidase
MSKGVLRWLAALAVVAVVVAGQSAGDDKDAAGKQQAKQYEKDGTVRLHYLLYLPEDYGKDDKAWPLLMFLHGAGESGSDLNKVKVHGPPKIVEKKPLPFIVVSPQSPQRGWQVDVLNGLLEDVAAKYKVDKDRLYLTGLSMGGFGTWRLAAAHPEKFAAIVPICGGGNTADAKKLKDLPIWIFHGAKDKTVPPSRSQEMEMALKEAGAKEVQFTLYPDAGHDSWTVTYNNPDLYTWLLSHKRGGTK